MSEREQAEDALEKRKAQAKKEGQIDNSKLYAGSPMYFYCRDCGLLCDTKPESYTTPPKKFCEPCQEMKDKGWL